MQREKHSIKQGAKDDRPREKLLMKGAETLSDSGLLAILIVNGTQSKTAIDLAKEHMISGKNSLPELGKLTVKELMKLKGSGEAKARTIVAGREIGRRTQAMTYREKAVMTNAIDVANYLQSL